MLNRYLVIVMFIFQVFEDALEDLVDEADEATEAVTINNNKPKKSSRTFKLKRNKSKKKDSEKDEEEISLEQGLEEGQQAIDLFFENKFAESREIAQRQ